MFRKSLKSLDFSYLFNIIFVLTAAFFVIKRVAYQYGLDHPAIAPSYLNNPQFAEQLSIEPAYTRPINVVLLGTSHVYKAHWAELLNRPDIANRGIGSDITEGYLHRLQYVINGHPRICFIEGGGNDVAVHIPIDTIISNLEKILDTLKAAHICPILQTEFYIGAHYPHSNFFNGRLEKLNKSILQLAASKKVETIDLNPVMAPDDVLLPQFCQPDNIHLNAKGYLCWRNEIEKVLKMHNI